MAKRVELGKFTDGGFGMRVSRPGYDVTGGAAVPMLFDSDMRLVQALYRGSMTVTFQRSVTATNPPYGLPGTSTTRFTLSGRYILPTALDGPKVSQFYFNLDISGGTGRRQFNETFMINCRYYPSATEVKVTAGFEVGGDVTFLSHPIIITTVLNIPATAGF